jgi:tRNA 2-thiocytidine biosynthesis protein TtcA
MIQKLSISTPIARPPWTKLGRKLESMCRKALYEFELLKGVEKLAIALSGGKDSLSLLFLLRAIVGHGFPPIELHAIHVGGAFSCGAGVGKHFLHEICDQLGVNLIVCPAKKNEMPTECYSCSRDRRSLIFEAAKQVGAHTVAFGHHRDDSIQTLLMNLFHKAEFAAMLPQVPMVDYGITIIRPLIYVPEEFLKEFAQLYGFARIVCQCPIGQQSMRRHTKDLVTRIQEYFPNVRSNLSHASLVYGSNKAQKK